VTILFAGHNFHFIEDLIDKFSAEGHRVLFDKWTGHKNHNLEQSFEKLGQANIIICEWALGNAVWYSKHVNKFQKLYIRFHRQEIETDFPSQLNLDSIEKVVFVSPLFLSEACRKFDIPEAKTMFIPNYVDTRKYSIAKSDDSDYTLGMVGIVPKMKRFDLALDLLKKLRKVDSRYNLRIKGKLPEDYPWMINREEEMEWYENQFSRLEEDKMLSTAVQFDGWGDDVPQWFNNIGYILSVSDFEGTHQAVAEGAASGATPIIINWKGAVVIYPHSWCYDGVDSMTSSILEFSHNDSKRKKFAKIIKKRYDLPRVYGIWSTLIGTKPTMYSTISRLINRKKRSNQEWGR
jgi:glycosyltransferase involved in cell wall biosynthesis